MVVLGNPSSAVEVIVGQNVALVHSCIHTYTNIYMHTHMYTFFIITPSLSSTYMGYNEGMAYSNANV